MYYANRSCADPGAVWDRPFCMTKTAPKIIPWPGIGAGQLPRRAAWGSIGRFWASMPAAYNSPYGVVVEGGQRVMDPDHRKHASAPGYVHKLKVRFFLNYTERTDYEYSPRINHACRRDCSQKWANNCGTPMFLPHLVKKTSNLLPWRPRISEVFFSAFFKSFFDKSGHTISTPN